MTSIFSVLTDLSKTKPYLSKDQLAEEVAKVLLATVPEASKVNRSTLRSFIFSLIGINDRGAGPAYARCTASSFTLPYCDDIITLTSSNDNKVMKVCPMCRITAYVGDPLCPSCNYVYTNPGKEEKFVTSLVASILPDAEVAANESVKIEAFGEAGSKVVFSDPDEGIRVTEADIKKHLRNVKKYVPAR